MKIQLFMVSLLLSFGFSAVSAQDTVQQISSGVLNGKAISLPSPVYPVSAKAIGVSGAVNVQVLIGEDGNVETADTVSGHPLLRTASETAALQAKFKSTQLSGKPVKVSGIIVYNYVLPAEAGNPAAQQISAGVLNGKAISLPSPVFPAAAMAIGAGGAVSVQVLIDEEGNVETSDAVSGHPLLRTASETAALQAKFKSTQLSGNPEKVSGIIVYNYELPTQPGNSDENEDLDIIGFTAALRIMTRVNADSRLKSVADFFFDEFGKEFNGEGLPEEFESLNELSKATPERRTEILADLNARFKNDVSDDRAWEIALGEASGDMLAESLAWWATGASDTGIYNSSLLRLKELIDSAPKTFPKDLLEKYNELIEFAKDANLEDPEVMRALNEKIDIIGDLIL